MTTPLRDALTQRINQVGPAHPDIEELVGLGEQRLRRRRLAAVAGTGAAVALAIALAIGGTSWNRSAENSGPIDRPPKHPHQTQTITRPIVYSDDVEDFHVGTIHVGDHLVQLDQRLPTRGGWDLALTDAGVVYGKSDGLWFTDGGEPRRIAEHPCSPARSGTAGPLAIWVDCGGDLVVFDTASGQEVARKPLPSCLDKGWYCTVDDVVGEHAYFIRQGAASGLQKRLYRLDISTGLVVAATDQMYAADLRSHSRGLVLGDSWRTGTATREVRFDVVGSRLVPTDVGSGPTKAFDAATGRPVRLRLPKRTTPFLQQASPTWWEGFIVFEWLDDDTVAIAQGYEERPVVGDIITCHLSDGRCRLAVPAGPPDRIRLVPGASFPQ